MSSFKIARIHEMKPMSQNPENHPEDSLIALSSDASNNLFVIDPGPCNAKSIGAFWKSAGLARDSGEPIVGKSVNPFDQSK